MNVFSARFVSGNKFKITGLVVVLLAVALLYGFSTDLQLFADDFGSWSKANSAPNVKALLMERFSTEFYRPFEFLLIRANQNLFGINPVLYRIVTILGHLIATLLVFYFARTLKFSFLASLIASGFFGISNANAMAVLSNDTAGQVYSVLLGLMACLILQKQGTPTRKHGIIAGVLLLGALLWKSSSVSFVACAIVILGFKQIPHRKYRALVSSLAPILVFVALFFLIRAFVGASAPVIGQDSRYQLWVGQNVILNIFLFVGALASPIGTTLLKTFYPNPMVLATGAALAISCAGIAVYGWRQMRREKQNSAPYTLLLLAMLGLLFFPDILIQRVSELYAYKPNAIFSLFFGVGAAGLLSRKSAGNRIKQAAFVFMLILILVANVISVKHKESLMRSNGRLARQLVWQVQSKVPAIPKDTKIIATNLGTEARRSYSVFFMNGVQVLGAGEIFEIVYDVPIKEFSILTPEAFRRRLSTADTPLLSITNASGKIAAALTLPIQ